MKIAVISISVYITGARYADIIHMHYLRNATLQLEVSEDKDAIVFLSEFTEALNFSPRVGKRSNISVIICVLGIMQCHLMFAHLISQCRSEGITFAVLQKRTLMCRGFLVQSLGFQPKCG